MGVRTQVSLLLDHGHPYATMYPIWMVSEESHMVADRLQTASANEAVLFQMAISTVPNQVVTPSTTKSMRKSFADLIKKMTGGRRG